MRKLFAVTVAGLAILALAVSPIFAGQNCAGKTGDASACTKTCAAKGTSASAEKGSCTGSAAASGEAKMVSADGMCKYMSKEECAKLCADGSKCELVNMSIKGMTCGGCEQSVTMALQKVEGVKKVVSVSYKDGTALVVVDPAKVKTAMLATAVSDKGFEAQIVPAVATTTTTMSKSHVCSPENKAACAAKEEKSEKTGIESTK
jgi:copper chaperone CopZ